MKTTDFNHPYAEKHNRVRGAAWLLSIFGVFGVCLLLAWLVSRENTPLSSHGDRFAMEKQYSPANLYLGQYAKGLEARKSNPQTLMAFVYYDEPAVIAIPNVNVSNRVVVPTKLAPSSAIASSGSYNDRIEREAREVLHGDYGNNPGRQKSLGADYAAVQARVNQILGR